MAPSAATSMSPLRVADGVGSEGVFEETSTGIGDFGSIVEDEASFVGDSDRARSANSISSGLLHHSAETSRRVPLVSTYRLGELVFPSDLG